MAHMTQEQWDDYINIINEWQEDAFQQDITWLKTATVISKNGEDNNHRFKEINLKGLIQYNQFRAWPITQTTDSGETDKESILVYFNIKYLKDLEKENARLKKLVAELSLDKDILKEINKGNF